MSPTTDDAPSAVRAHSFNPVVAAIVVAIVVATLAYVMLVVSRALAGDPIEPWIHVLLAIVRARRPARLVRAPARRILADLRASLRRLSAQPRPAQQAYLDGYLDAARARLDGQGATVIELRPRTPA